MSKNRKSRDAAAAALAVYRDQPGRAGLDADEAIADLMADLAHLADLHLDEDHELTGEWMPKPPVAGSGQNTYSVVVDQIIRHWVWVEADSPEAALAVIESGDWLDSGNTVMADRVVVRDPDTKAILHDTNAELNTMLPLTEED